MPQITNDPLANLANHQTVKERQCGLHAEDTKKRKCIEWQGIPLALSDYTVDELLHQERNRQVEKGGKSS